MSRKADISCRRCGYQATVDVPPPSCPGCGIGVKPAKDPAVVEFERALDKEQSECVLKAIFDGWEFAKLQWKRYPHADGRLDLTCEGVLLAKVRVTFDPPSIKRQWVGPEAPKAEPQVITGPEAA